MGHLTRREALGKNVVRMLPISSGIFQVSGIETYSMPFIHHGLPALPLPWLHGVPRIVYGDRQLLQPKIPTPAFRGCPGPEGVISSENLCQCTRSRIVILSCVPCGLHALKFGNLKDPETEVGPSVSDLYLMKRHVLPYDNLYLERRFPVFIVLSLSLPLVLCAELPYFMWIQC